MNETDTATSDAPEEATSDSEPAENADAEASAPEDNTATDDANASDDDGDGGEEASAEQPVVDDAASAEDTEGADDGGGEQPAAAERASKPAPKKPGAESALRLDRDRMKQQLMRTAADFDNFRRRSRREVEEARMRGKDDAVLEFLPVIDNLERAVTAAESAENVESVVSGIKMVLNLFEGTAERMGLNKIPSVGARFDPAVHDAIQHQESDEHPPGSIMNEVAPGYMFGKRLIRPAMVVVARKPEPKPDPEGEDEPQEAKADDDAKSQPPPDSDAKSEPPQADADASGDESEGTDE